MNKTHWYDCLRRMVTGPAPYHGLINQGATCYLNSVLQVLFMTKDFREAVKRYRPEYPENEDHIDHQLSAMFEVLEHRTATTNHITRKLSIENVFEQQDAAEYFQKILQLTSPEASQMFLGLMSHRTSCHRCLKQADVDSAFWYLPLALMDSPSDIYCVEDGIEQFFRATEFRGENQMYCNNCDDKVDASTKYVIKHHPDVLMLLLKRFDFSYRHMSYIKINCAVMVPPVLQIPESQTYELYAAVDHVGDLRAGHYNAAIKSEDDGRWYWFDDTVVQELHNQPFLEGNSQLSETAYLLFYRKMKRPAGSSDHDDMEVCTNEAAPVSPSVNGDQSQDAGTVERKEEEDEERRNVTDDPDESSPTGMIRVVSEMSPIPRSDIHQESHEGKKGVGGDPQDVKESIKQEEKITREDEDIQSDDRNPEKSVTDHKSVGQYVGGDKEHEQRKDEEVCVDPQDANENIKQDEKSRTIRVNEDMKSDKRNPEERVTDHESVRQEVGEYKDDDRVCGDDQDADESIKQDEKSRIIRDEKDDRNPEKRVTDHECVGKEVGECKEDVKKKDEGGVCGDPQEANEGVKEESDNKKDEQRKDVEDEQEGQIGRNEGKPDRREQKKPGEDLRFEHGGSGRKKEKKEKRKSPKKKEEQGPKPKTLIVKVVDEEYRDNSIKTEIIETRSLKKNSQDREKVMESHKTDRISSEPHQESETVHLRADNTQGFSDVQLEAAGTSYTKKKKQCCLFRLCRKKQHRKKKKETVGCFPNILKCLKHKKKRNKVI